MIFLNGRANADLDWTEARKQALDSTEDIVWKIDFGLFSELKNPLSHKSQHMSLRLSLEHFRDGLWREFQDRTKEIVLYEGSLDFSADFIWDSEQRENLHLWLEEGHLKTESFFCADVLSDYLNLLTLGMPEEMPFSILLDASGIKDPVFEAALRNRERFPEIKLHVINSSLPIDDKSRMAICYPSKNKELPQLLANTIRKYTKEQKLFRMIPEEFLIQEWDGLDFLVVDKATVDLQLKRKLQGFEAAGGVVFWTADQMPA